MKFFLSFITVLLLMHSSVNSQSGTAGTKPYGSPDDIAYAEDVWEAMTGLRLAGENQLHGRFYPGSEPHGYVLETFDTKMSIQGTERRVLIKRNYGPEGVAPETVAVSPEGHLESVTVMIKRDSGYDTQNLDWFWVKYLPGGAVAKDTMGVSQAGRLHKGSDLGCIACHSAAPGGDYLFTR
jgi:hypothetical protein